MFIPLLERARLQEMASRTQAPFAVVQRARLILALGAGEAPSRVARRIGWSARTVRKWRARWEQQPLLESLFDRPRSGRPPRFGAADRCLVLKLACDRPDGITTPFRQHWTQDALREAVKLHHQIEMSRSSVMRVLSSGGLRPHKVRYWLHSPDPDFESKVRRICDLYLEPPKGAVVLCIDEKPMQALERKYPGSRGRDASVREEFEYKRHGTATLLAAFNVRTGKVFSKVVEHRDAETTVAFLDEVARKYRGRKVFVVWDNLSTHMDGPSRRWSSFNERHGGRFQFVYTPVHASWVNQIETWFSILQRRVLRYGSFDSRLRLVAEVQAFIRYWNACLAHPFRWTFTGEFARPNAKAA